MAGQQDAGSAMPEVDRWRALGLLAEAEDTAGRVALLHFLVDKGIPLDELVDAARSGRLAGLAGDRLIRPGRERLNLGELAARAEASSDLTLQIWRACGFPDPGPDAKIFSEADVELVRVIDAASGLFGRDVLLQLARVISAALARVAEALISTVGVNRDAPLREAGAGEIEVAEASAANASFLPELAKLMDTLVRHHIEAVNDRRFALAFPSPGNETVELVVGFADLVGSTALSQQLSTAELASAMTEFDAMASDVIGARGGRLVKLIGDEVMFVAADAANGCVIALELVEAFNTHAVLPPLRAGIARGEILARDGDYFGPTVALAARVARLAEPGTVLVTTELKEQVPEGEFDFRPAGSHRIKGFAEPSVLFAVTCR